MCMLVLLSMPLVDPEIHALQSLTPGYAERIRVYHNHEILPRYRTLSSWSYLDNMFGHDVLVIVNVLAITL